MLPLVEHQATRGIVHVRGWDCRSLGRAFLLLGRLDAARRLGNRALESSTRQLGFAAHALHLLGDILLDDIETHPDRFDAECGEAYYREAMDLAIELGMRPLVAHCHLGLGKLYGRTGKHEQAHDHLTTAMKMYREMDMRFWLEQAEVEMQSVTAKPSALSSAGWSARASIPSSPNTTRRAGARRSTRPGWSTRRPARGAPGGSVRRGMRSRGRPGGVEADQHC